MKDFITCGLSLDSIEHLASFLVEALLDHVLEEERLRDVDGVLDEELGVLLVKIGIEDSQVGNVLLLGVLWVCQTCQSLLEQMLGRQG